MQNDRLQGILFDRSETIDLVPRTRKDRFMHKVTVAKHTVQQWRSRPAGYKLPKLPLPMRSRLNANDPHYYVIPAGLNKKARETEMSELLERLNIRD